MKKLTVMLLLSFAALPPLHAAGNQLDYYDFPTKPGTWQWAELDSHDAMVTATQLPAAVLESMSTEGLIETCLSYPLLGDIMAYENLQLGVDAVAAQFNGLRELMNRKDAGEKLLRRYKGMDPGALNRDWDLLRKGQYDAEFTNIELLLAQYAIQARLTPQERDDLILETRAKAEAKGREAEVYGHFGQERTKMVTGRLLEKTGSPEFATKAKGDRRLKDFLETGTFADADTLLEIDLEADRFVTERAKEGK